MSMKKLARLWKEYRKATRKHRHFYTLRGNSEEIWLECSCQHQEEVPEAKLEEAYIKMRNQDWDWGEAP